MNFLGEISCNFFVTKLGFGISAIIMILTLNSCSKEDPASPDSPEPMFIMQNQPTSGPAPLWVTFCQQATSSSQAKPDTLIWDFGNDFRDTLLQNDQGVVPCTKHIYFDEGVYDVSLTAIVGTLRSEHKISGLVTVTESVERPVIDLAILEEVIEGTGGSYYRYSVTPIIENLLPGGVDDWFFFSFSFNVYKLRFQGIEAIDTSAYECELGNLSEQQFYWPEENPFVFRYGESPDYTNGDGSGPVEIAGVECDVGVAVFQEAYTTLRHYTRLDSFGNNEFYTWDCKGPIITYYFESEDLSHSYFESFRWMNTSFEEMDGVVLKINGEIVELD